MALIKYCTDAPDRVADDAAKLWDNLTNLGHFPGLNTLKSHLTTNAQTPVCPGAGVVKCTAYNSFNVLIHIIIAVAIALPIGLMIRYIRHRQK